MNDNIFKVGYKFNQKILGRNCGEVFLAFNPDTSDMFEFNATGAYIFGMLKEEISFKELYEKLCVEYNVEIEDIDEDVKEIIDRMIELGVIIIK